MSDEPWTEGDELEPVRLPAVSRLSLIKYAGASGDYNPIHTIDAEAEAAGLPGIIQHGMLTMAQISRLLTIHFDKGYVARIFTRFTGMLFLDEVLVVGGRVTGVEEGDGETRYDFEVHAWTTDDREIARGEMQFVWLGDG